MTFLTVKTAQMSMFAQHLDRQKTYSVSEIEILTKITGHLLRVWERRYTFIKAKRTKTNIRYYTEEQLKLLLNVAILKKAGFKISAIDSMTALEIQQKVLDLNTSGSQELEFFKKDLTLSMVQFDIVKLERIITLGIQQKGFLPFVLEVLYPFLQMVGLLWTSNQIAPAQEHIASNIIRQKLIVAIDNLESHDTPNKSIALCLPEGENHEIGLLLAQYLTKLYGWKAYYFGQNMPLRNLATIANTITFDYILTFFTIVKPKQTEERIHYLLANTNSKLIVAGNSDNFKKIIKGVNYINSPKDLISLLDQKK